MSPGSARPMLISMSRSARPSVALAHVPCPKQLWPLFNSSQFAMVPFKSNHTGASGGLWERMFHYYQFNREEFLSFYHKRSNIESTFSMVKAKFGDSVRSKTDVAMMNEVLAKLLCHNICCVIQSQCELGVEPIFWKDEPRTADTDAPADPWLPRGRGAWGRPARDGERQLA